MSQINNIEALQTAVNKAELLYTTGGLQQALESYQSIVLERLAITTNSSYQLLAADGVIIERLADITILSGDSSVAKKLLLGLRNLHLKNGNQYSADYITIKLSHLALESNDLVDTHTYLRELNHVIGDIESLDLSSKGLKQWESNLNWAGKDKDSKNALVVRLYIVMGGLLAAYGQYTDALLCLKRGEVLTATSLIPSISQVNLPLKISLASTYLASGDFIRSRDWLLEAESTASSDYVSKVRILELSGKLALLKGFYGEALNAYDKALSLCEHLGFPEAVATASLNYAHLLILLNQTQKALEFIANAESHVIGNASTLLRINTLQKLANARRESHADTVAVTLSVSELWRGIQKTNLNIEKSSKALDVLEIPESANFLVFFEDRSLSVQWLLGQNRFKEASQLMEQLCDLFTTTDSPFIHARIKALQGMVDYYLGNDDKASINLSEAVIELHDLDLLPEVLQSKRILAWSLSRQQGLSQEVISLNEDVQFGLEKIALSMDHASRSTFFLNKWSSTEEYFLGEISSLTSLTKEAQEHPWWKRIMMQIKVMKKLNSLLTRVDNYKRDSSTHFFGLDEEENVIPTEQKVLPLWKRLLFHRLDTATIYFLVLPDRVLLIQHTWLSLGFGVSAITQGDLRDLVSAWYRTVDNIGSSRDIGASTKNVVDKLAHTQKQTLEQLGNVLQLQALLEALPSRVKSLRIIPDDSLMGFPFSVLKYHDSVLPDRFALSVQFSKSERKRKSYKNENKALLVGVSQGSKNIHPLAHVDTEISNIRAWMRKREYGVEKLMNADASQINVIEKLKQVNFLHIACHGVFQTDNPEETGFVLIPEKDKTEILSLTDLAQLDLRSLEHATLSSCWAADRFILPGMQTIGLPETFLRSGTGSVLACLWPVDDLVAVHFMSQFYSYLDNHSRDEALRRTQLDCINNQLPNMEENGVDTSIPLYWAGFILYGATAKL